MPRQRTRWYWISATCFVLSLTAFASLLIGLVQVNLMLVLCALYGFSILLMLGALACLIARNDVDAYRDQMQEVKQGNVAVVEIPRKARR